MVDICGLVRFRSRSRDVLDSRSCSRLRYAEQSTVSFPPPVSLACQVVSSLGQSPQRLRDSLSQNARNGRPVRSRSQQSTFLWATFQLPMMTLKSLCSRNSAASKVRRGRKVMQPHVSNVEWTRELHAAPAPLQRDLLPKVQLVPA